MSGLSTATRIRDVAIPRVMACDQKLRLHVIAVDGSCCDGDGGGSIFKPGRSISANGGVGRLVACRSRASRILSRYNRKPAFRSSLDAGDPLKRRATSAVPYSEYMGMALFTTAVGGRLLAICSSRMFRIMCDLARIDAI